MNSWPLISSPTCRQAALDMGTSVKMLEDHHVKLRGDAKRDLVEASGFKLGLRLVAEPMPITFPCKYGR